MSKPIFYPRSARNTMMDLLARRDHSEKEMRQKLKLRKFSEEEINKAIEFACERSWLPDSLEKNLELSVRFAQALHRKNKGILYINDNLRKKGLPPIKKESELELEKALYLLENKKLTDRAKMSRFLISRGFDLETIGASLRIYLKRGLK